MSALCQKQTYAVQQNSAYSIHVVGSREQRGWYNRRPMTEPREFLFSAAYEDD